MTARRVTATIKGSLGYVTHVVNPQESWSPRPANEVILDIELGQFSYFVGWPDRRTEVLALDDDGGTYLSTHYDGTGRNNLLDLPDLSD